MHTNERYPHSLDQSRFERSPNHEARNFLAANPLLLGSFYFSFYQKYCGPKAETQFNSLLALGEINNTVIVARHNDALRIDEPTAYLIKQYDLASGSVTDWDIELNAGPKHIRMGEADEYKYLLGFSGQGDSLQQRMTLQDRNDSMFTAILTLSGQGSSWRSSEEEDALQNALLLPFQALHDLKLTEKELHEKIIANGMIVNQLGKSALTSTRLVIYTKFINKEQPTERRTPTIQPAHHSIFT